MKKPIPFSRRDFLKLSSTALALSLTAPDLSWAGDDDDDDDKGLGPEARVRKKGCSILQGLTTADSTQLTIDVPKDMMVSYRLLDAETGAEQHQVFYSSVSRSYNKWRVDKVGFEGLRYPGRYKFQVLDNRGQVLDERFLKTLDLNRRDVRIGLLSCMLDWSLVKKGMWNSIQLCQPDILFFLGDNVYGDLGLKPGPKLLWKRYIRTRQRLPVYHWKELVPIIATWDDHDFGLNDAGGAYGHKDDSADVFHAFFAQRPREGVLHQGPGISSVFFAFGQQFVFADNRYYRRLPSRFGGLGFWGDAQVDWVFNQLRPSLEPVWILQGSQVFGGDHKKKDNSFENHRFEGEHSFVMEQLRRLNTPVIFGSGDIHRTEIVQVQRDKLGFPTIELTSSSMHSFPEIRKPSNPRVSHYIGGENFLLVDLAPSASEILINVTGIGRGDKLHFSDEFVIG